MGQQNENRAAPLELEDRGHLRRVAEDVISQRLFSILLAAYAAETRLLEDPVQLAEVLELIRTQSAASLEDLRRLAALG